MGVYQILSRKKPIENSTPTKLAKVLSAFDLTALGIGSTLGVGIYVLAGGVAKDTAGPAVILSFLIAAIASVFAGLCYAEFGARVPRAGSAYVYCYVTIGEFIAFLMGWNLILEYSIGSASVVKGLSTYVDSITGLHSYFNETMHIDVPGLSPFPDVFAFGVTMLFTLALAFGAKESSIVNNVFTFLNLSVVVFVIIAGSFKSKPSNWAIPATEVEPKFGTGGFAPYGMGGILRGAARCFYGFIGFDCIATAGEEARNPKRSIPIAIIGSLFVVFLAYFGISTVLTMMLPYYLQNENAPLPYVFRYYGWTAAEYIVSIGAVFGLCASLMGSMFPLPRIVYAMSSDGLIFKWMGEVSDRFHTPMYGTLFVGVLTGILAAFFNLEQLVHMMSIGTLMAYSIVAACVMLLRYEVADENGKDSNAVAAAAAAAAADAAPITNNTTIWHCLWNSDKICVPTKLSSAIVTIEVTIFCVLSVLFALLIEALSKQLSDGVWWTWLLAVMIVADMLFILLLISRQPTAQRLDSFTVPFIPWLPGLSIVINVYLMMKLDYMTWVRFIVWIVIGLVIYFAYGIRKSVERTRRQNEFRNSNNTQNQANAYTSSREILVLTG